MKRFYLTLGAEVCGVLILTAFFATRANADSWSYVKPACIPDSVSDVRWKRYSSTFVWAYYCDTPRGIQLVWRAMTPGPGTPRMDLTGKSDAELFKLDQLFTVRDGSLTEKDVLKQLLDAQGIKVKVSGNPDAPTYLRNADGTRGAKTETRAKYGEACNRSLRLVTKDAAGVEKGTSYFALDRDSTLYASCTVTGAVSK